MRTAMIVILGGLTFFYGRACVRSLTAPTVRKAHAEDHYHQCRQISETAEVDDCCRVMENGKCVLRGKMACYERACKICEAPCRASCSGCQ